MPKRKLDLSNHLQKKQQQRQVKRVISLSIILLLMVGLAGGGWGLSFFWQSLPWHWQLFLKWVLHRGERTQIPPRLYKNLNDLCYSASSNGVVDGYQGNREIAYALGKFECRASARGQRWVIRDIYQFNNLEEAQAGSPLAIFIVYFLGKNYYYIIEDSIPKS